MNIHEFDFHLPEGQIAQYPATERDGSWLFVVHRQEGRIEHRRFHDIVEYFRPGDLLIRNDSRVIHARLIGTKETTDARIEIFLIRKQTPDKESPEGEIWEALIRPAKRLKAGDRVFFSDDFSAEILEIRADGSRLVRFDFAGDFSARLEMLGKMPLPPYIRREAVAADEIRYQTVYARTPGSVAAPTAGLHFTEALLARIREKGAEIADVTLHVGPGTFRPVQTARIEDHRMHRETWRIMSETAERINRAKREGRRIICIGTTSVRTLESAAQGAGKGEGIPSGEGETDIFIYPGYRFKVADGLLTNFHLPGSTLLMLVSAFYDREKILACYEEAVERGYSFFSYGDAMLLI